MHAYELQRFGIAGIEKVLYYDINPNARTEARFQSVKRLKAAMNISATKGRLVREVDTGQDTERR